MQLVPKKWFFNGWRLGLIGVFALSVLIYVPALWGRPVWEDPSLISGDGTGGTTLMGAFTHAFLGSYYRPLTSVSFLIDRHFADNTPYIYHQTSVLLHAATALLLCWLTLLVTKKPLAAVLAGVCFAVQPAQVGAVAWIGGRTDVLSTFFVVLTVTTLVLRYQTGKQWWLPVSLLAFLIAVLAKEQSLALLPAVPASVFVFGSKKWRDAVKLTVPYLLCGLVFWGLSHLGGKGLYEGAGQWSSVQTPLLTAADYGSSFLAPTPASQLTFSLAPLQGAAWVLVGLMFLAAAAWLGALLWKRNRPLAWIYVCALLLYLPVANFVPVPSFWVAPYRMAETGTFVACLFGALAALVYTSKRVLLAGILTANLACGALVTWVAVHDWTTGPKLNEAVLSRDPHFFESSLYAIDDRLYYKDNDGALAAGDRLLTWLFGTKDWMDAASPDNLPKYEAQLKAQLHTNFGNPSTVYAANAFGRETRVLLGLHRDKEAEVMTVAGLHYSPRDASLNYQYGCEVFPTDRLEAERHWETALEVQPNFPPCAAVLGREKFKDGDYREAARLLQSAVDEVPIWGFAWVELADAKTKLQDYRGALDALDKGAPMIDDKGALAERRSRIQALMGHSVVAKTP